MSSAPMPLYQQVATARSAAQLPLDVLLDDIRRACIVEALDSAHGHQQKAAAALGMHRNNFYVWMVKLNIPNPERKGGKARVLQAAPGGRSRAITEEKREYSG